MTVRRPCKYGHLRSQPVASDSLHPREAPDDRPLAISVGPRRRSRGQVKLMALVSVSGHCWMSAGLTAKAGFGRRGLAAVMAVTDTSPPLIWYRAAEVNVDSWGNCRDALLGEAGSDIGDMMRSWSDYRKAWSDKWKARADSKLRETEKELNNQQAVLPWARLTPTQQGFWETRYKARLMGMLNRSTKFRELGQSIRFVSVLMGATVAALSGLAGVRMRIIVAILGVTLAAVNAAPSIFRTELRVIINRRYIGRLLTQGWIFALAATGTGEASTTTVDPDINSDFDTFRKEVERLLARYDADYERNVYEAGKN
jgi:hypothetical protein